MGSRREGISVWGRLGQSGVSHACLAHCTHQSLLNAEPVWAQATVFAALVVALPLLSAPHAHARRPKRRQPAAQVPSPPSHLPAHAYRCSMTGMVWDGLLGEDADTFRLRIWQSRYERVYQGTGS